MACSASRSTCLPGQRRSPCCEPGSPPWTTSSPDKLATELGDLPLAAAQAAGYQEQTDLPPADYLRRSREHRATLLARGKVDGYHG